MQYKNVVSICLSRFLSEYKITDFYDKLSLNVGAKDTTSGTIFTSTIVCMNFSSLICSSRSQRSKKHNLLNSCLTFFC